MRSAFTAADISAMAKISSEPEKAVGMLLVATVTLAKAIGVSNYKLRQGLEFALREAKAKGIGEPVI